MKKPLALLLSLCCTSAYAELQPEPLFQYNTLPETYPPHWLLVHDATFFHMLEGRVYLIDPTATDMTMVKGMVTASFIADFHTSATRSEFYVAETFYSRGSRGERTDVITIYDRETLAPSGEVLIPAKRASTMPNRWKMQLTNDERFLLLFNLSPATSVTVVNMVDRKFVGEIPIPACAYVYPTGDTGFTAICGDGSLHSFSLRRDGEVKNQSRTEPFFDVDADALFEKPAIHKRVAYFPTFEGDLVQVDMSGERARVSQPWALRGEDEGNWRPGGIQIAETDADGLLYVLMHSHGGEGTHKDPGEQVWVFNTRTQECLQRISLQTPALSITLTPEADNPTLVATNVDMALDIYAAKSGKFVRTLPHFGQETPFVVYPQKQAEK